MTAAVVALALLAASLGAALVTMVWRYVAQSSEISGARESARESARDLDIARAALDQRTEEFSLARERSAALESALAVVRKKIANERIRSIVDGEPGDAGRALDIVLAQRAKEDAARAVDDRGDPPPAAVPGPGASPHGPEPSWIRALDGT